MEKETLFRYLGAKGKLVKKILPYFPSRPELYHYHEPFLGSGPVAFRTIRTLPFKSYNLSDSFEWITNLWLAVRGDLTTWGDIIDRLAEARAEMLPEHLNEALIRFNFEEYKLLCRMGDYFAFMFLCQYALRQLLFPQRLNLATFGRGYLRDGLRYMTIGQMKEWRETMQRATIKRADAFDVLESLGPNDFAYIDSPYVGHHKSRVYADDWFGNEHERLRDILHTASFKWAMSLNDQDKTYEYYLKHPQFTNVSLRYPLTPTRSKVPPIFEWLIFNY